MRRNEEGSGGEGSADDEREICQKEEGRREEGCNLLFRSELHRTKNARATCINTSANCTVRDFHEKKVVRN